MRKLTTNGIEVLSGEEMTRILELVDTEHSSDFHFLAFDRQLKGFSPLGTYLLNYPDITEDERKHMLELTERQEVGSFYPKANLSLYPVTQIDGPRYFIDMANYEKHFADILKLNDNYYKTKYLFVDFWHGPENFDEALVIQQLSELLSKSELLEAVYINDPA